MSSLRNEAHDSQTPVFITGFVLSNSKRFQKNMQSSPISAFMICAMTLPIERFRLDGRWKRLPTIWGM